MPVSLAELVAPNVTALVTQECQHGVIGDASALPELAAAAKPMIGYVASLVRAARRAGVPVIHCVAQRRADGAGSNANARLFAAMRKSPVQMIEGTTAVDVVPEIGVEPTDVVLGRYHGLSPMTGTDLDPILRNLGVRTIVGVGVSVNVAMLNFAFDAVNRGYQFVIPRDAVAGVPADYVDAVFEHTLSLVATPTTTDEVVAYWAAS